MEMEAGSASFLGAVDELSLVLVCAGICAGNLAAAHLARTPALSDADLALCRRGLRINVWFGDFIECCYPYMESSRAVSLGGYLGSALSSAWLVVNASTSTAYRRAWPICLSPFRSHWPVRIEERIRGRASLRSRFRS
jgi:hypothetical protein